jgi:hypothetical protein
LSLYLEYYVLYDAMVLFGYRFRHAEVLCKPENSLIHLCVGFRTQPGRPRTRARHARRQAHIAENSGDADEGLTDDDDMEEPGAAERGPTGPEIIGKSKTNSLKNFR